jgi:hypothetical protein
MNKLTMDGFTMTVSTVIGSATRPVSLKIKPILVVEDEEEEEEENKLEKNNELKITKTKYDLFWEQNNDGKPSQIERYEAHNSPPGILKFIRIGGGPKMGVTLEKFARTEFTCLQKRDKGKNTGYDHKISLESKDIYVEQKSSGHWGENDFKWQHIEDKHKWHILLLCGIEYTDIKFWVMNRQVFTRLIEEKKITNQGNNTGESSEGMWFNYSDVKDSLIQIYTNEDLLAYIYTI